MKNVPTNLNIMSYIYKRYYNEFVKFERDNRQRITKIYVPIDCQEIAKHFGVDGDIIFGRLYYHLENLYGYKQSDGNNVHFFALKIGSDSKCINFPYMASILASLKEEHKKFRIATIVSILAIITSVASLTINLTK